MADQTGQQDINGIDVQKLAVAYAFEARIFRNFVRVKSTTATEIRWVQQTAGIIASTKTTNGADVAPIKNVPLLALPNIVQPTFTRNTSYTKIYRAATETMSYTDINTSMVNILPISLQSTVVSIEYGIDTDIWNVLSENQSASNINTNAATGGGGWDAASGQDPYKDILKGLQDIRTNTYEKVVNPVLFLSPKDYTNLLVWLVSTKGSSIPGFSSARVADGVLTEIAGCAVVVSNNVTADYALVCDPSQACVYYELTPTTTGINEVIGVGKQVVVWAEGIAVLEKPKFCSLITNTQA